MRGRFEHGWATWEVAKRNPMTLGLSDRLAGSSEDSPIELVWEG
jgi:hypothetical protein